MKSHEYAAALQRTAELLLLKPEFDCDSEPGIYLFFHADKERFIAAVRALGSGTKSFSGDDLIFQPTGTCLRFYVNRNSVCRKVQEVKWECEPLLTGEEMQVVEEHEVPSDIPF